MSSYRASSRLGDDVPDLSICREQLLHVRATKAEVGLEVLKAKLGYLLIKGFKVVEMSGSTEGPSISERLLYSVQPGCRDRCLCIT